MSSGTTRRLALLVALALLALALTAGVAGAKTLTLEVKRDNWLGTMWSPHCNPGSAQIWGPGGYYRTCSWVQVGFTQYRTFSDAPAGSYRVRYYFTGWTDDGWRERNDYFTIAWWQGGRTSSVTSP